MFFKLLIASSGIVMNILLSNLMAESKYLCSKIPPKKPLMDTDIWEKQAGWLGWGADRATHFKDVPSASELCRGREEGGGGETSLVAVLKPGPSEEATQELLSWAAKKIPFLCFSCGWVFLSSGNSSMRADVHPVCVSVCPRGNKYIRTRTDTC